MAGLNKPPEAATRGRKFADLGVRTASAVLMLALAGGAFLAGPPVWPVFVALIAAGMVGEWVRLCELRGRDLALVPLALILATALPGPLIAHHLAADVFAANALVVLAAALLCLGMRTPRTVPLGILLIGLGLFNILRISQGDTGWKKLGFLLAAVWATDIGAYFTGRLVGGPKLAPAISPGKTQSGAWGGLACAIAASLLFVRSQQSFTALEAAALAANATILSIAAQSGDLLESAVKRRYGKKDSGSLIPGHGGLLDRFDGLLAASAAQGILALLVRIALQHRA